MIKGPESSNERYLVDLGRIEQRQERAQRQISSGLRVNVPSDAPENIINILALRSDLKRAEIIDTNLQRMKAEVDSADAALRTAVQIVERARVLAAQAATSTATNRQATAAEVRQLHDRLVALTGTISEGRYVFSGDLDTQMLYEPDPSSPAGVRRLADANNTRLIEDVQGNRFSVSKSAHEIFDARDAGGAPLDHNAFNALHELAAALDSDDPGAVQAQTPKLIATLDHLNRIVTFYGHTQNRLTTAMDETKKSILARTSELSANQDTDVAAALVELNSAGVHQRAALGAFAYSPRTTLFDLLG